MVVVGRAEQVAQAADVVVGVAAGLGCAAEGGVAAKEVPFGAGVVGVPFDAVREAVEAAAAGVLAVDDGLGGALAVELGVAAVEGAVGEVRDASGDLVEELSLESVRILLAVDGLLSLGRFYLAKVSLSMYCCRLSIPIYSGHSGHTIWLGSWTSTCAAR